MEGSAAMVRNCKIDDKRLEPLKECFAGEGPDEWPDNYLSCKTVVYSCGRIARAGEATKHDHDPAELALCKRLSQEAADIMAGTYLGMSDEGNHEFDPFFVTANAGDKVPQKLTDKHVRAAFGRTIWPGCRITLEPLKEEGEWWQNASAQDIENGNDRALQAWRSLIAWFGSQAALHGACFVSIDDLSREPIGVIFPRLVLAATKQGSLVGLFSCVVWT